MKKNKFLRILFFNLLILGLLFASLNLYIDKNIVLIGHFLSNNNLFISHNFDNSKIDINNYNVEQTTVKQIEINKEQVEKFCGENRREYGTEIFSQKNPIVILGCSYAYGHGIKRNETFSYLLSEISQRPIYDFSYCGGDLIGSLDEIYDKKEITNADYVIYIYMHDHINRYLMIERLYRYYEIIYPQKNKIKKFFIKIPLIRLIIVSVKIKQITKNYPKTNESSLYLKNIINKANNKIKELTPNAQFIIILYDQKIADMYSNDKIKFDYENQNSKIWEELQNETDIKVIHSKDLTGFLFDKEYKLNEDIADWHPNAKAWKVFTPLFVKKYIK